MTQDSPTSSPVHGLLLALLASLLLPLAGCSSSSDGGGGGGGGPTMASNSTVSPSPASGVIADATDTAVVTITVLDGNGDPVVGETVEIAVSGAGNTIVQPAGPTNGAGEVTATVSSTTAEVKTITATVDPVGTPVVLDATPTVEFMPFALVLGQAPAAEEQQNSTFSYFTVECQDSLGNVLTADNSTDVTIALDTGSGTLGGTLTTTVVDGVATFSDVTHDAVEAITLLVTSAPAATPIASGAVDVQASPVTGMAIARGSVDDLGAEPSGDSSLPAFSANGRFVAFISKATDLVTGDTNAKDDTFVHDRLAGTTERVSVDDLGAQGDDHSKAVAISASGRHVAFVSRAGNLVTGDTNVKDDVFVHDRETGAVERVSVDDLGAEGNDDCLAVAISADGRHVAFISKATNLVTGDANGKEDTFVHDRLTGTTERVSVDDLGAEGNEKSKAVAISADGRYVAFVSQASNLVVGDTNAKDDAFVHDRQAGTTERVSVDDLGAEADDHSLSLSISADGRYVAFSNKATNLVPGITNGKEDIFVFDRQADTVERVSVDSLGAEANEKSLLPSISADGNLVAFQSRATNLVTGDVNVRDDVFVHNRTTGATIRVSVDSVGAEADNHCFTLSLTPDGRFAAFESSATNLVTGDTNTKKDIFLAPVTFP